MVNGKKVRTDRNDGATDGNDGATIHFPNGKI